MIHDEHPVDLRIRVAPPSQEALDGSSEAHSATVRGSGSVLGRTDGQVGQPLVGLSLKCDYLQEEEWAERSGAILALDPQ